MLIWTIMWSVLWEGGAASSLLWNEGVSSSQTTAFVRSLPRSVQRICWKSVTNCFREPPLPDFPTSLWEFSQLGKLAPSLFSGREITMDHATRGQECFISLDRNTNPRFHFNVELYLALIEWKAELVPCINFKKAPSTLMIRVEGSLSFLEDVF